MRQSAVQKVLSFLWTLRGRLLSRVPWIGRCGMNAVQINVKVITTMCACMYIHACAVVTVTTSIGEEGKFQQKIQCVGTFIGHKVCVCLCVSVHIHEHCDVSMHAYLWVCICMYDSYHEYFTLYLYYRDQFGLWWPLQAICGVHQISPSRYTHTSISNN